MSSHKPSSNRLIQVTRFSAVPAANMKGLMVKSVTRRGDLSFVASSGPGGREALLQPGLDPYESESLNFQLPARAIYVLARMMAYTAVEVN